MGIREFTCDADGKGEIETFIKNPIHYFGEMNHVAKMNAMNGPGQDSNTGFHGAHRVKRRSSATVECKFAAKEQPAYAPKKNMYAKKQKGSKKITGRMALM